MKLTYALLIFVLAVACSRSELTTGPATAPALSPEGSQPIATDGTIAGFVIDRSDQCIIGARVELIDGPRAVAAFVQTVCGFWDYGEDIGYSFHNLPIGMAVTVRAAATGYKPAEVRGVASMPYSYTTMIVLTKEQ